MGTLQFIGTGVAGGFPASNPQDKIIDLVQALRSPYRQGAVFVMNSATATRDPQVQDRPTARSCGSRGWRRGSRTPCSAIRWSRPRTCPTSRRTALSIAFGNFKAGYLIAERNETKILRDPFTNKPFVHFYATKRVGGQVMNSEAIKLLKFI